MRIKGEDERIGQQQLPKEIAIKGDAVHRAAEV